MALRIISINTDATTAHTTAQVRVEEEVDGHVSHGAPETVGIDHWSLLSKYHAASTSPTRATVTDAIHRWLQDHHAGAVARKHAMDATGEAIAGLKGVLIEFTL